MQYGIKAQKKDTRDKLWKKLEAEIQERAADKDRNFILRGSWKKFIRKQGGLKVFQVDGEWVRNNLSAIFGHAGHGYVHEFIPLNEIWVGIRHPAKCVCRNVEKNRKMSQRFSDSAVLHEITERKEMRRGMIFWKAHQVALQKEKEAGLLKDPFSETK
ncbi:MAG: hypothetical protein A2746_02390 [Candidatus Yanofskybacteria bacterium RIFCSPHIGHO2_01_FULL_44_22]|uniref:Uncharacterized protein n=1 Tax=Candidatus Yanofskybacteria bacterium RIFCSPHIGHO2_01_FULL_44_22 TaxID=1802669 RepID=A0A1F8EYH7_9BACT|nr:MAG: hypothetical protein A2746_02390 [Candidatus Yanofskybacteria bacterium RIFCSPHIGHO2_01_FULL_44_22]